MLPRWGWKNKDETACISFTGLSVLHSDGSLSCRRCWNRKICAVSSVDILEGELCRKRESN